MSDFIKVNFKNGISRVMPKASLMIEVDEESGAYFVSEHSFWTSLAVKMLQYKDDEHSRHAYMGCILDTQYITREEYDRLCKELGVE
jgi:hypothetical protein